ncbi:MAG: PD-(D/E)XK nuclease-like domain-containing protein [Paludibacteraceae bacterium]|nr:PD-(D/E)XK nuclease-like domain-containing protein [Paludibacteraceae bacterium]
MTEKEYRQHPAISRSQLFKISESPEKFKHYMDTPQEPTPALLFGQVFHKLVLQKDTFLDDFAVEPVVDKRTAEGKRIYSDFLADLGEKTIVSSEMLLHAREMAESLNKNPFVPKLLNGEIEKSFFWVDDMTGEECKCRVDCLNTNLKQPIIVDLKTTDDASTDSFIRSAIKYGYDFQSAMYIEGVEKTIGQKPLFVFIVVEKKPPYAVNILQADELFVKRGYDLFREYIGIYHDCKVNDNWYGYMGKFDVINNLSLPAWLAKEIE